MRSIGGFVLRGVFLESTATGSITLNRMAHLHGRDLRGAFDMFAELF